MTTTTGDAEDYERLNMSLESHRRDGEAWRKLGGLLKLRRQIMDPRWANRRVFARERGINYKLASDIETAYRTDFELDTIVQKIAPAYAVTYQSIGYALGGGRLEPLRYVTLPAGDVVPLQPAAQMQPAAPAAVGMVLSPERIAAAAPYATRILVRLRDLAAVDIMRPDGYDVFQRDLALDGAEGAAEVFPGDHQASLRAARRWEKYADDMPEEDRVWLISSLHAGEAAEHRPDSSVG